MPVLKAFAIALLLFAAMVSLSNAWLNWNVYWKEEPRKFWKYEYMYIVIGIVSLALVVILSDWHAWKLIAIGFLIIEACSRFSEGISIWGGEMKEKGVEPPFWLHKPGKKIKHQIAADFGLGVVWLALATYTYLAIA